MNGLSEMGMTEEGVDVGEGVAVSLERHEKRVEEAPGDSVVSGAFVDLGEGFESGAGSGCRGIDCISEDGAE